MTDSAESADQPLHPRQQSLLRSSVLMASGTMVSRILGFVRSAMLIAVVGVYAGVADAFGAANTLPNTIYNLLAAGIFDAVLIPQIVRALKRKDGSVYINRLITAAGTILFLLTVVAMIGAPLLISIFSSGFPPEVRALAITFALWCLPQIFFYGLYNLLGEVLNARGIFGPYMWAPVVNNIVAIIGLGIFLAIWGRSPEEFLASAFTTEQLWVLAGSATLGVILQAFVLMIPMRNSGVKLRPDFHFRGTDFGSASKVAGWTFATLMVSQLGVLSTTNITSQATRWVSESGAMAATGMAYQTAFMLYMVPQSLISVTLATAIFTRLANNVADGDYRSLAHNYHLGTRLIIMLSMLAVAIMIVTAVPIMQIIMMVHGPEMAGLYAPVLVALVFAIPSTGIILISQRVFFAFENVKPVFLMGIVPTALQILVGWSIFFLADAHWWTIGAALSETVCRVIQGFIAIFWTAHLVRTVNAGRVVAQYLLYFIAFAVSALVGWGVLTLISPVSAASSSVGRAVDSLWKLILVSIVITIVYFFMLRIVDPSGHLMVKQLIISRLPSRFRSTDAENVDSDGANAEDTPDEGEINAAETGNESEAANDDGVVGGAAPVPPKVGTLTDKVIAALPFSSLLRFGDRHPEHLDAPDEIDETSLPKAPSFEEIIAGEYASRSLGRSLGDSDPTSTGQIPLLYDFSDLPEQTESLEGPGEPDQPRRPDLPGIPPPPVPEATGSLGSADIHVAGADSGYFDPLQSGYDAKGNHPPASATAFERASGMNADKQASPNTTPEPTAASAGNGSGSKSGGRNTGGPFRFNPTGPMIGMGLVIIVFGLIFSYNAITAPNWPESDQSGAAQSEAQSDQQSDQPDGEETTSPDPAPEKATPKIKSIAVFSWQDDGGDHGELTDALTDKDADTLWYTRYYDINQFKDSEAISLLITLKEEAEVSQITLDVAGQGGELVVTVPDDGDPRSGKELTSVKLERETVIKLPEPTKLSEIGLVFRSLPTDDEGLFRAQVSSLSVK